MGQSAVDDLIRLLDLEDIEVNIFRGRSPDERRQRVFGGQVAGQALVAASRTVDAPYRVHSLHAYFLRPGDTSVPILYEVDRIRDGRSFVTRRVVAIQHGRAIFNMSASFHLDEESFDHQDPMPADLPDPESLPALRGQLEAWVGELPPDFDHQLPFDARNSDWTMVDRKRALPPYQRIWIRADGHLPDDPVLHNCVVTYLSDMTLLDSTLLPHATAFAEGDVSMASLDHAMWFHRPFRADEWLLYSQRTPTASGARGFATGSIFTQDGRLAVSVVQEGLIRRMRPPERIGSGEGRGSARPRAAGEGPP
jgi:acyl-CoA thioesterase-2